MHAPAPLQALGVALAAAVRGTSATVDAGDHLVARLDFPTPEAMIAALAADMRALITVAGPAEIAVVVPPPARYWRFHLPRILGPLAHETRLLDHAPVRACLTLLALAAGDAVSRQAEQELLETLVPVSPARLAPLTPLDAALSPEAPAEARQIVEAIRGWLRSERACPQPLEARLRAARARFWPEDATGLLARLEHAAARTPTPSALAAAAAAIALPPAEGPVGLWEPAALVAAGRSVAFQLWLDVSAPAWPGGGDGDEEAAARTLAALCAATTRGMRWYGCAKDAEGRRRAGRLPERLAEVQATRYAGLGGRS